MCFAKEETIHDRNIKGNHAMTKLDGFPNFQSVSRQDRGKFANFRFSNFQNIYGKCSCFILGYLIEIDVIETIHNYTEHHPLYFPASLPHTAVTGSPSLPGLSPVPTSTAGNDNTTVAIMTLCCYLLFNFDTIFLYILTWLGIHLYAHYTLSNTEAHYKDSHYVSVCKCKWRNCLFMHYNVNNTGAQCRLSLCASRQGI